MRVELDFKFSGAFCPLLPLGCRRVIRFSKIGTGSSDHVSNPGVRLATLLFPRKFNF